MNRIVSKFKKIYIEIQRVIDHGYRKISGLPQSRFSLITSNILLGGQYTKRGIASLKKQGVHSIVNMRETDSFEKYKELYSSFDYLHLPTIDLHAPSIIDLEKGSSFIQKKIDAGEKVYIHCKAGEGRGPSMVIAYLISTGLVLEDAMELVRTVRTFIKVTPAQLKRLAEFEKKYSLNK